MQTFKNKLSEHGLNPDEIIADGKIHRFKTNGKDKSGWYVYYENEASEMGIFGDWRTGFKSEYCDLKRHLSDDEYKKYQSDLKKEKFKSHNSQIRTFDSEAV